MTSDPLSAVGCAWAMQSAGWLVDETAIGLTGVAQTQHKAALVDSAVQRYRARHTSQTGPHHHLIADYATARPFNEIEEFSFAAAARDPEMAAHFHSFGSRLMSVEDFLAPDVVTRMEKVNGHGLSEETLRLLAGEAEQPGGHRSDEFVGVAQ